MLQKLPNEFVHLIFCGSTACLICCCAQPTTRYHHLKSNIDAVFSKLDNLDPQQHRVSSIPHAEAIFCIEKAATSARRASSYQVADNFMLGSAAFFGGAGLALSSAAIGNSDKKGLTISAVVFSILPGIILGTREIFKTYEIVREERLASSRNVNTSISILRSYALRDDPAEVIDRFRDCRDDGTMAVNWEDAYPKSDSSTRLITEEAALESAEFEIRRRRRTLAETKERLGALNIEKTDAESQERNAFRALNGATTQEKNELSARYNDRLHVLENKQALFDEAQLEAERTQLELEKAIRLATLQRIVREKTKDVITAYAKLRRAVLYQSHTEVSVAFDIAEYAKSELETARINLAKEQKIPILLSGPRKKKQPEDPTRVFHIAPLSNPYDGHP